MKSHKENVYAFSPCRFFNPLFPLSFFTSISSFMDNACLQLLVICHQISAFICRNLWLAFLALLDFSFAVFLRCLVAINPQKLLYSDNLLCCEEENMKKLVSHAFPTWLFDFQKSSIICRRKKSNDLPLPS